MKIEDFKPQDMALFDMFYPNNNTSIVRVPGREDGEEEGLLWRLTRVLLYPLSYGHVRPFDNIACLYI